MKQEYIPVGRIVNAHGTRGEVRLQPDGLTPSFLTRFDTFYLDGQPLRPTANHVHKSFVLLKLPEVDDMNAALALKGKTLSIRRADALLKEGEYFEAGDLLCVIDDLFGRRVEEVYAPWKGVVIGFWSVPVIHPRRRDRGLRGDHPSGRRAGGQGVQRHLRGRSRPEHGGVYHHPEIHAGG